MTDDHKLQSDEPTLPGAQDEHKQPASDHTDTTSTSSSSSASSTSSAFSAATSPAAAAIEQMLEKDVTKAEEAKAEGNKHFANKDYEQAIESYTQAILLCPTPPTPTPTPTTTSSSSTSPSHSSSDQPNQPDQPDGAALTTLLATLYSNRAAAHLNLTHYPQTITDTTTSITLQPTVKALLRRSIAYEKQERYAEAAEDVKAAIAKGGLDGKGAGVREEEVRLKRLEVRKAEKEEAMKGEMLGKLKDLGNGLLGKFGMSLDQFKAIKDPNTGSYSISFKQ